MSDCSIHFSDNSISHLLLKKVSFSFSLLDISNVNLNFNVRYVVHFSSLFFHT